mmetsp:Transcript_24671/g.67123  ORF Transcript_24671/g.67123 Transcript_24671/m.67123 type:complete len:221 (+) Transcript_24671:181-843(+)
MTSATLPTRQKYWRRPTSSGWRQPGGASSPSAAAIAKRVCAPSWLARTASSSQGAEGTLPSLHCSRSHSPWLRAPRACPSPCGARVWASSGSCRSCLGIWACSSQSWTPGTSPCPSTSTARRPRTRACWVASCTRTCARLWRTIRSRPTTTTSASHPRRLPAIRSSRATWCPCPRPRTGSGTRSSPPSRGAPCPSAQRSGTQRRRCSSGAGLRAWGPSRR